jgi:curli biogenesis system outer membrane secretion channel CsgG
MMQPMSSARVLLAGLLAAPVLAGCGGAATRPAPAPEPVMAVKVSGPKLRIAVVDFENKTTYGQRLSRAAAEILVTELARTDRFVMVERQALDKVMAEQKLGLTGAVDPSTAAQMGKVLGLAAIVTGAISQFGTKTEGSDMLLAESKKQVAEATVDVRVIDATTAQILYAESGSGRAEHKTGSFLGMGTKSSYDEALEDKALRAAITGFVGNVVRRLTQIEWSCRVAEVDGRTLYVDAGRRSNLNRGAILQIVSLGNEIKSPTTGLVIGRKETVIGKAKVTGYLGEDGAQAVVIEGSPPARGDLCRMLAADNPKL